MEAKLLTDRCITDYFDKSKGFFSYNRMDSRETPVRKYETIDNVIPSSNAVMAENLIMLSSYFADDKYKKIAVNMVESMFEQMSRYPASYALWASLMVQQANPFSEVAIVGHEYKELIAQLSAEYLPNIVLAATSKNETVVPLLSERYVEGKTLIYVCRNQTCELPETDLKKVVADLSR